jgi:UDP-4-amino-4,6-dideoxy-N-acetyl-beta-L-altrosamine transaminase
MNPIPYGKQHITEADLQAVNEVLQTDFLTGGPAISRFESAFAQYVGARYAVAVSSGTAALHLCALALGTGPGQRYICTPLTFVASANCILYCGGKIDLVDIDPHLLTIDLDRVEKKLSQAAPGTYQGIIPVDFAGQPLDMERLRAIADRYDCRIIEDACHAPGGFFEDTTGTLQSCGNGRFADLAIFSFHPVKHIACGEGGMITTQDESFYQQLLMLRSHGITRDPAYLSEQPGGWYYEMQLLGYNYRMSDIHAALGFSQLQRAGSGLERRKALARRYDEAFADTALRPQTALPGHAYHLYVIQVPDRKNLYDYLRTKGIYAQIHYIPIHYQPYYQALGWKKGDFPITEAYYDHCLSIPMYPDLSDEEQTYVIETIRAFYGQ